MKPGRIIFSVALALAVAIGSQARAQIAWSSVDSGCVVQSAGESLASIDAAHGTVSFKTGAAGDIKLTCPVRSLHQLAPNAVNGLGITFYTDDVNQCFILADLLRTNLNTVEAGASLATINTSGHSFSPGRQALLERGRHQRRGLKGRNTIARRAVTPTRLGHDATITCGFCWVKAHAGQIDMFRDSELLYVEDNRPDIILLGRQRCYGQ